VTEKVLPYGRQLIDDDDVAAVVRALRSDFLTTGPEIDAFEAELAAACGARHAVVVANGTAALHCAYAAAGITEGDQVVTTPLTFSATANMVLALGGRPVFADIDDTLCLDPAAAERALTPQTRVLAPVDFGGQPAAMDDLTALARRRGLLVVEDASHSLGGSLGGRPVGSLADLTTFSFHPVKTITTGEGGAVLTNDPELAQRARDFRNHGLVRDPARLAGSAAAWYYEVQSLGFNYRLSALHCALGRSQLKKLAPFVQRRAEIVASYRAAFEEDERLRLVALRPGCQPAWHLFTVQVKAGGPARNALFSALARRKIGTQVHYIAVTDLPLYRRLGYDPGDTPRARAASETLLSLPLFPAMTDQDVDRVIIAVREGLDERS
jgi:UDP-4-amino-4,6-dideoxy-N-acetyl-beta-L-altrosamine transaminase